MSILETVIVVGVTIGAVIALLLFVWALVLRSRHEVYIAPFQVAGSGAEPALGAALTNMLRARLERLKRELAAVQRLLEEQPRPTGKLAEDPKAIVLPSSIEVPRGVFEPVNIDVSIGKVSVGGLLSWVQQWALESRTLQFTVFLEADHAIVSASLDPLSAAKIKDLWIETGTSVEEIVRKTAHALLQSSGDGPIAALDLDEFESLLLSLYDLADLNRRALSGVTPADSRMLLR